MTCSMPQTIRLWNLTVCSGGILGRYFQWRACAKTDLPLHFRA